MKVLWLLWHCSVLARSDEQTTTQCWKSFLRKAGMLQLTFMSVPGLGFSVNTPTMAFPRAEHCPRFTWAWTHVSSFCNRPLLRRLRPSSWRGSRCGRGCQKQQLLSPCRSPSLSCLWHSTRYAMTFETWETTRTLINPMLLPSELEKPNIITSVS